MHNVLRVNQWSRQDVYDLFQQAEAMRRGNVPHVGGMAAMVFAEPSTRTMVSFQMAATRLGMNICSLDALGSSLSKGESLEDTLSTLEAIGVSAAVIRTGHDWPGSLQRSFANLALINAGSGVFEHPTQALLDAFTMYQEFGSLEGRRVVIAGDVAHSRVARSNAVLLNALGAEVLVSGPPQWAAADLQSLAQWVPWDQACRMGDVIMMLRVQNERHQAPVKSQSQDYLEMWGLTHERLQTMRPHAVIMHPGPVNRDVEIASELVDHPRSRILKQVENGVLVRMALLWQCVKGGRREQLVSA